MSGLFFENIVVFGLVLLGNSVQCLSIVSRLGTSSEKLLNVTAEA